MDRDPRQGWVRGCSYTVPHRRVLTVFEYYGITDPVLSWVKDFLSESRYKVVVGGQSSSWFEVTSGIPQGSVLGQVLFIIYINTMVEIDCVSDIYLYADDTKIFHEINSSADKEELQEDINKLYDWTKESLLRFHPQKCVPMRIGSGLPEVPNCYAMDDTILEISEEEKDRGVLIDSKLSFEQHIASKMNKANPLVGLIRRSFEFLEGDMFRRPFTSIVRPHLEYAYAVWNPQLKKHIVGLENVRRRASRMIPGMKALSYEE